MPSNISDSSGMIPLAYAIGSNNKELISMLVENKANINKTFIPKKYNALLFYSLEKNGNKCHPLSLHAGMPVETGQKYIANVWLREKEYHSP